MNTSYQVVCLPGRKYAYEHRLVWQRHHGPIPKGFHVHHINGNRKDNSLENLELLPSSEHHRHHFKEQGATAEHKKRAADNVKKAWAKMPMLTLRCVVCSTEFHKRQHLTLGSAKYCSKQCSGKDYYKNVAKARLIASGALKG